MLLSLLYELVYIVVIANVIGGATVLLWFLFLYLKG